MKVKFRTNLDLSHGEKFPENMDYPPPIGSRVQSSLSWGNTKKRIELEVVGITVAYSELNGYWHYEVELHLPQKRWVNISQFDNWYEYIKGFCTHEQYCKRDAEIRQEMAKYK